MADEWFSCTMDAAAEKGYGRRVDAVRATGDRQRGGARGVEAVKSADAASSAASICIMAVRVCVTRKEAVAEGGRSCCTGCL